MSLVKASGPNRRDIFGAMAGAALAGTGFLRGRPALAQDTPVDCAPISSNTPAVPYQPNPALPVRIRKSAFELSNTEVDRLKAAYAALRKLPPTDPRAWLRQGYVHCWYCGGGTDNQAGEEIHGSWFFFPWHRAFLHFHERILCKLLGDDTFALPYWDWDSQGRQVFPTAYGDPGDPSNPLSDMLRSAKPGAAISKQAVSAKILNTTINAPNNSLFMGTPTTDPDGGDAGAMENAPHGPVHVWTGDTTMKAGDNDMGVLATAAQDPVFFAHHGNIDRLWSVWLGLSSGNQNYTSTDWTQHAWQFYDENSVWTQIQVSDLLDPATSLRSDYAKPTPAPIWKFKPRNGPSALTAAELRPIAAAPLTLQQATAAPVALTTAPVTRSIALPPAVRATFAKLATGAPPQFVLHIRGIAVPSDGQALFNVFLDLPSATAATSPESPNFVGTVTVLARTKQSRASHQVTTNAAFDITDVLAAIKGPETLSVTLVPVAGGGAAPSAAQASFKQISIETL